MDTNSVSKVVFDKLMIYIGSQVLGASICDWLSPQTASTLNTIVSSMTNYVEMLSSDLTHAQSSHFFLSVESKHIILKEF